MRGTELGGANLGNARISSGHISKSLFNNVYEEQGDGA